MLAACLERQESASQWPTATPRFYPEQGGSVDQVECLWSLSSSCGSFQNLCGFSSGRLLRIFIHRGHLADLAALEYWQQGGSPSYARLVSHGCSSRRSTREKKEAEEDRAIALERNIYALSSITSTLLMSSSALPRPIIILTSPSLDLNQYFF